MPEDLIDLIGSVFENIDEFAGFSSGSDEKREDENELELKDNGEEV